MAARLAIVDWRGWTRLAAVGWLATAAVFVWQASMETATTDVALRAVAGVLLVGYGAWSLARPERSNVRYLTSAAALCAVYAVGSALFVPGGVQAWQAVPLTAAILGSLAMGRAQAEGAVAQPSSARTRPARKTKA